MRELPVRNLLDRHDQMAYILDDIRHHMDIDTCRTEGLDINDILNNSISYYNMTNRAISVIKEKVLDTYAVLLAYLLSEGFDEKRIIRDLLNVDLTVNKYSNISDYLIDFRNSLTSFDTLRREDDTISYTDLIDSVNTLQAMARFLEFDIKKSIVIRYDQLKAGRRYNHYIQFSPFLEDYAKKVHERVKLNHREGLYLLCEDIYDDLVRYLDSSPLGSAIHDEYMSTFRRLLINYHEIYVSYLASIYIDREGEKEGLNKFIHDLKNHPLNDRCLTLHRFQQNITKLANIGIDGIEVFDDMKVYWNRYFLILNIFRDLHLDPIEIYMESTDSTSNTELTDNGWRV